MTVGLFAHKYQHILTACDTCPGIEHAELIIQTSILLIDCFGVNYLSSDFELYTRNDKYVKYK